MRDGIDISNLYHYTKTKNILQILKKKTLKLNDLNYMDDPSDRFYGMLYTLMSMYNSNLPKVEQLCKQINAKDVISSFVEGLDVPFYSMSFSLESNNQDMWEKYSKCNNANCIPSECELCSRFEMCNYKEGCVIEFDGQKLDDMVQKYYDFVLREVLYDYRTTDEFDKLANIILNDDVDEFLLSSKHVCGDLIKIMESVLVGAVKDGAKWGYQKEIRALFKEEPEKKRTFGKRNRMYLYDGKAIKKGNSYIMDISQELKNGMIKRIIVCNGDNYSKDVIETTINNQGLNNIRIVEQKDAFE